MIFISSSSINSRSITECVDQLAGLNIRNIELSGGAVYSDNIMGSLKELKDKYSLNYLIHNYFPPPKEDFVLNIASEKDKIRKQSIELIRSSVSLAHEIGAEIYSVHAGYAKHYTPNPDGVYFNPDGKSISPKTALSMMYSSLSEITEYSGKLKVKIGVENLFPFGDTPEDSLLCTPEDIFAFLDSTSQDENIGFLLDLGHLLISSTHYGFDKDAFIEELKKNYAYKVIEIHLSGNDGTTDQHGPLSSDNWQFEAALRFDLETVPVTLECRGLDTRELSNQYSIVKNSLERNVNNES
jgi:sugar phosphate isomerase/epimerase